MFVSPQNLYVRVLADEEKRATNNEIFPFILDFRASRSVGDPHLSCEPSSLWHFVIAVQAKPFATVLLYARQTWATDLLYPSIYLIITVIIASL